MTYGRTEREMSLRGAAAVMGWLYALAALGAMGWGLLGRCAPADWSGYQAMYDGRGAYLARQGRDPLFVWLIVRAGDLLGGGGYDTFRWLLFGLFVMVGSGWAGASVLAGSGLLASVLTVGAAFLLKSLVQIREGLAFLVLLVSLCGLVRGAPRVMAASGCGALLAALIHSGTAIFVLAWLLAAALPGLSGAPLARRRVGLWLTVGALALGVGVAWLISRNAVALEDSLRDFGVDNSGGVAADLWKFLYWLAMGGVVAVVRKQVIDAAAGCGRFGERYATVIAAGLMPTVYVVCLLLVFSRFDSAAVVSLSIRLLLTTLELGLMIVAIRGRANWITAGAAAVSIVDQARLVLT
jgi:hypothetical protein